MSCDHEKLRHRVALSCRVWQLCLPTRVFQVTVVCLQQFFRWCYILAVCIPHILDPVVEWVLLHPLCFELVPHWFQFFAFSLPFGYRLRILRETGLVRDVIFLHPYPRPFPSLRVIRHLQMIAPTITLPADVHTNFSQEAPQDPICCPMILGIENELDVSKLLDIQTLKIVGHLPFSFGCKLTQRRPHRLRILRDFK